MQQSASAATALITTKPLNGSKQRAETKRRRRRKYGEKGIGLPLPLFDLPGCLSSAPVLAISIAKTDCGRR